MTGTTYTPEAMGKQLSELIEATRRRESTEAETLREVREIKQVIMGTVDRRGLIHRVDDIEKFHAQFKRWGLAFIVAVAGGQPVVDRMLPAREQNAVTASQSAQRTAVSIIEYLVDEGHLTPQIPAGRPAGPPGPPNP